jgi:hypothetical protein
MIVFLSVIATALGVVQISTDLRSHYLHQENIIVDILVFNDSDQPHSMPNLEEQTWRVQFEVDGAGGKRKYSSSKTDKVDEWKLAPRQTKKVRFTIPNSEALPLGKHSITINISLPNTYQDKKDITIVSKRVQYADISTVSEDAFFPGNSYLWTQLIGKDQQAVYLNRDGDHYLCVQSKGLTPYQSIAKGEERHLYWLSSNQLSLQSLSRNTLDARKHNVSFPWPNATKLTRGVTDHQRNFHLPIWIPSPQKGTSGTIQMIVVDYRGIPTYRKISNLPSPPKANDMAITEQHVPLFVVQHSRTTPPYDDAVYLYTLSRVGNPKIDVLPPKSSRIYVPNQGETIVDVQFGVHKEHGLIVYVISKKENIHYLQVISHQGNTLEQKPLLGLPENTKILTTQFHGATPSIIGQQDKTFGFLSEGSWIPLKKSLPENSFISLEGKNPNVYYLQNGKVNHRVIQ